MKVQDFKEVSPKNNVSEKINARSTSLETLPSTSKNYTTYKYDIFCEKLQSSMRNVCSSELCDMSPITSHVTAFDSTSRSSHRSGKMILYFPILYFF